MGNFFSGLAQTAVRAAPFAAQVLAQRDEKQKADMATALARLHQQSADNTASVLANIRAGEGLATIGKTNAETSKIQNPTPKKTYDSTRGVMVDETAGTFSPIAGLPDRPVPPKAPGNIDPLSDPGITAAAKRAGAVAAAEAPFKKDPNAPPSAGRGNASITKAIANNQQQLAAIDQAIKAVHDHPQAFGLGRGAPIIGSIIDQRVDPEGIRARSLISNIGSLQIHDRTGAAMSVHEEKRLAGFVPQASDTPEKIIENLNELKASLGEYTSAMQHGGIPEQATPHAGGGAPTGNVDLRLSDEDRAHAQRDPAFAAWLKAKGYTVP